MSYPTKFSDLPATLGGLHGKRPSETYVLIHHDGSTLIADQGTGRPWSSPNKKLAEFHASNLTKETGTKVIAVTLEVALRSILIHPKNQPPTGAN